MDEVREALALKVFKVDRVMQMLGAAIENGHGRVVVTQDEAEGIQLRRTQAAAFLLRHLAKLGYYGTWVEVPASDPRSEAYHELVVSAMAAADVGEAQRMVMKDGADNRLSQRI